jgi:hypothetical protein
MAVLIAIGAFLHHPSLMLAVGLAALVVKVSLLHQPGESSLLHEG